MRKLIMRLSYWVMGFNRFKPDFSNVDMCGMEDLIDVSKEAVYYDITGMSENKLDKFCRFNSNTRGLCTRKRFGNKDVVVVFVKKDDISCIIHETVHVHQCLTGNMYNTKEVLNDENERITKDYGIFLPEYYKLEKEIDARYTQYIFEDNNNLESLHRI